MSYDERGRPEALLRYTENLGFDAIYYEYNSMNQITSLTAADPLRRHTTWYGYNNNGQLDSVWTKLDTVGSGTLLNGNPNNWEYQAYSQSRPTDAHITYVYTPTGSVDTMFYPLIDVATWYNYSPRKWLDTLVATDGTVDLFRQELTYDDAGYITAQWSQHNGSPSVLQHYANDNIGQLTDWTLDPFNPTNPSMESYAYDAVGNRTSLTIKNGPLLTVAETRLSGIGPNVGNPTAGPNQLLSLQANDANSNSLGSTAYTYDADGSMVTRTMSDPLGTPYMAEGYSYSSWRGLTTEFEREDLMAPPGPALIWKWGYSYNAMGEREQKRELENPGVTGTGLPGLSWSYYLLNGTKEQLSVWEGTETSGLTNCAWSTGPDIYFAPSEYLIYGVEYPGIREDIPRLTMDAAGTVTYKVTDHLASIRQTLDGVGTVVNSLDYEPFGTVLTSLGSERQGFNSREHDGEDGMSNNGVRRLDEGLGRFVAVDPLWTRFPSNSPYQYSFNSPNVYVDPTGRQGVGIGIREVLPYPTGGGGVVPSVGGGGGGVIIALQAAAIFVASLIDDEDGQQASASAQVAPSTASSVTSSSTASIADDNSTNISSGSSAASTTTETSTTTDASLASTSIGEGTASGTMVQYEEHSKTKSLSENPLGIK